MSCQLTKCAKPECTVKMKACKLKNGLCPSCYSKEKQKVKKNV